jgi:hypothetical protein
MIIVYDMFQPVADKLYTYSGGSLLPRRPPLDSPRIPVGNHTDAFYKVPTVAPLSHPSLAPSVPLGPHLLLPRPRL